MKNIRLLIIPFYASLLTEDNTGNEEKTIFDYEKIFIPREIINYDHGVKMELITKKSSKKSYMCPLEPGETLLEIEAEKQITAMNYLTQYCSAKVKTLDKTNQQIITDFAKQIPLQNSIFETEIELPTTRWIIARVLNLIK